MCLFSRLHMWKKFLDLVKSSIFCALLNLRIIWPSTEQFGIWDERQGCHLLWRRFGNRNSRKQSIAKQFLSHYLTFLARLLHDHSTVFTLDSRKNGGNGFPKVRHATWLDPCLVELGSEPNTAPFWRDFWNFNRAPKKEYLTKSIFFSQNN